MPGGELAVTRPLETARIVSSIPGRLRLRLPAGAVSQQRLAAAVDAFDAGNSTAAARPRTASLVVQYDVADTEAVWAQLADLGLRSGSSSPSATNHTVEPSVRVQRAIVGANESVRRPAAGNDLETLVALGFGMLALRQYVRDDQRLADAPWYLLGWYAWGTFQKLH